MKIPVTRPGLFLFHRIGLHIARPISSAVPFQRTSFAIRILRHALQGAQFHYSLVVLPGIPGVHHQACQFRKGFFPSGRIDRSIYRKQARKHSEDIPVHDWIRLVPYKGNDGRRRIFSYPFQRDHILIAFRKYPTETFHNIFAAACGYGRDYNNQAPANISTPRLPPPKPAKPHPGTVR